MVSLLRLLLIISSTANYLGFTIISPILFLKNAKFTLNSPKIHSKRAILGVKHYSQNTRLKIRCLTDFNCELPDFIGLKLPQIRNIRKNQRSRNQKNYLFNKL